jgi:hypothetical protein
VGGCRIEETLERRFGNEVAKGALKKRSHHRLEETTPLGLVEMETLLEEH